MRRQTGRRRRHAGIRGRRPRWRPPSIGTSPRADRAAPTSPAISSRSIAPHAGLMYSGPVAAHAYRLLRGRAFDVVGAGRPVALRRLRRRRALSRRRVRDAVRRGADRRRLRARDRRRRRRSCTIMPAAHAREHSLEMQLPFLARLAPGAADRAAADGLSDRGDGARRSATRSAVALRGRRALLVASTDLSHYHDAATAAALDRVVIDCVARFDAGRPAGARSTRSRSTPAAADRRSP